MNKNLNQNIILDKQGMSFSTTSFEKANIWLFWKQDIDLDLMLFYKTIDGNEGGVFSNCYRQNNKDLGSLHDFPHIQLSGNLSLIHKDYEKYWEEIAIKKFNSSISEMYIIILNYDSALENIPVDYSSYDCQIKIHYNADSNIEIPVNCPTKGIVYVICRIKGEDINIINESKCISLKEAYEMIPGFKLICS